MIRVPCVRHTRGEVTYCHPGPSLGICPANPGAYAAAALTTGVSTAQHKQIVVQHKERQTVYAKYLGAQ
jgi:hypothetical protein